MADALLVTAGPLGIAVGLLLTVGALLSRFGLRTVISPSRIDQRPEYLALGLGLVLQGISLTTGTRIDDFWGEALDLSAMALFVIALVLILKGVANRSKNASEPG
jgi:hypothetical protein